MTYYLADFAIRDGDNEYEFQFLVQKENKLVASCQSGQQLTTY